MLIEELWGVQRNFLIGSYNLNLAASLSEFFVAKTLVEFQTTLPKTVSLDWVHTWPK